MPKTNQTVADLTHNPRNPRKVTDKKLAMLKKAVAEFGDLGGVVFNTTSGQLVGGHQRTKVMPPDAVVDVTRRYAEATPSGTVAEGYITMGGERFSYREVAWDDATEKAANLAANKGAGDFDMPAVADWIGELDTGAFDMDLTMFDEDELAALMAPDGNEKVKEDTIFEPDEVKETDIKIGDVMLLGTHRLMCGDSGRDEDVSLLMDGELAKMVFTDPPYNHGGEDALIAQDIRKSMKGLADAKWDVDFSFLKIASCLEKVLSKDVTVYVTTSHHLAGEIWAWMKAWADHVGYCVWTKNNPMPSLMKRHWTWNTELICYATRGKHTFIFPKEGHALSTWEISKSRKNDLHPTMKPVSVPFHAITHSSQRGDAVLDLFGGAGSTLMACEQLGRKAYVMEIEPRYCQVIVDRWEAETGTQAVLIGNGTEMAQVADA